jgi:hypothetical protein
MYSVASCSIPLPAPPPTPFKKLVLETELIKMINWTDILIKCTLRNLLWTDENFKTTLDMFTHSTTYTSNSYISYLTNYSASETFKTYTPIQISIRCRRIAYKSATATKFIFIVIEEILLCYKVKRGNTRIVMLQSKTWKYKDCYVTK